MELNAPVIDTIMQLAAIVSALVLGWRRGRKALPEQVFNDSPGHTLVAMSCSHPLDGRVGAPRNATWCCRCGALHDGARWTLPESQAEESGES